MKQIEMFGDAKWVCASTDDFSISPLQKPQYRLSYPPIPSKIRRGITIRSSFSYKALQGKKSYSSNLPLRLTFGKVYRAYRPHTLQHNLRNLRYVYILHPNIFEKVLPQLFTCLLYCRFCCRSCKAYKPHCITIIGHIVALICHNRLWL